MPEITKDKVKGDHSLKDYWRQTSGSNPAAFLSVVNKLLAKQREKAFPFEAVEAKKRKHHAPTAAAPEDDIEQFMAAALVRTTDNRFFIASNIHMHHSPAYNQCAEASAAAEAAQAIGMDKIKIADLWFMGGKGNPAKGISISTGEEGKRHTPCGSCRHVIQSHGINDGTGTNVHLLPLNDGSWKLQPFDHRKQDKTPREMVMSKSARELLPLPELRIGDPDGQMKRDIAHGVQWLLKPPEGKKGSKMGSENGIISSLGLLERDIIKDNNSKKSGKPAKQRELQPELLDAINRTLHEAIKRELYRDGPRRILRATACILRTTSGEYILGSNFEDGIVRSTPEGEFNAIGNIRRRDITDAFILNLDIPAIERTVPRWFQHAKPDPSTQTSEAVATVMLAPTHASDPIAIPTLQGNTLERLKKSHTRDPNAQSPFGHASTIPLVHLFTLGAPGRFDPQRHCHSQPLHHFIPDGYEHPKSTQKGHSTPRPLIAPDTLELLEQLEPPQAPRKPRHR